jgi:hypothetical protein
MLLKKEGKEKIRNKGTGNRDQGTDARKENLKS